MNALIPRACSIALFLIRAAVYALAAWEIVNWFRESLRVVVSVLLVVSITLALTWLDAWSPNKSQPTGDHTSKLREAGIVVLAGTVGFWAMNFSQYLVPESTIILQGGITVLAVAVIALGARLFPPKFIWPTRNSIS